VPKTDSQGRWLTVDGQLWDRSMDESKVHWLSNEGIRVSRILEYLQSTSATHPLAAAVLQPPPSPGMKRPDERNTAQAVQQSEMKDGELQVTIPVRITVSVGDHPVPASVIPQVSAAVPPGKPASTTGITPIVSVEKVEVDQSNYEKRLGYQPDFLGDGDMLVPLPVVADKDLKKDIVTFNAAGKKQTELKYWKHSLVMNKARRLAFFSTVNVDANQRPADSNREGDKWFTDTRISEEFQIGNEFYMEQKAFEVDRALNPFDRGHLVRRMDATWGSSAKLAKRNGDDTFH
jgi:endonuclease G